ncbi:MAG: ADP-ribosylglycohydrolase family protein [Prevotellaceae bacterium]|jgi:ADP-ribosylglycohydrolase|nr:ADP-ribosylglycohydrolase family protein [Prevotellaceae bacterium]
MTGAIIGDYVGSVYEFDNTHDYDFQMITPESSITDDSIMTIAVMDAILQGKSYGESLYYWGNKYPNPPGGYGSAFYKWLKSENPKPYYSFGNGAAMRVSPVGWAFSTLDETLSEAKKSAECTHNHPEGIKGAQAVAASIYILRNGGDKQDVKNFVEERFGYDLSRRLADIRPTHTFNESCMDTVPKAIICYMESSCFTDAIRLAVSLGGDSDTLACITGSIAEAHSHYEMPIELIEAAFNTVPNELKDIFYNFQETIRNGK